MSSSRFRPGARGGGTRGRGRRARRLPSAGTARRGAETRLRRFRQSTPLAIAFTGLLLLTFTPEALQTAQDPLPEQAAPSGVPADSAGLTDIPGDIDATPAAITARESAEEATGALRALWNGFQGNLPKYFITLGIFLLAWVAVRLLRALLRLVLARWERADAITALSGVVIWMLATGVALSVLLGDIRALAGSLGLIGLALSWALQGPIESFTGWLLNSFKGYYRVGDRIAVGEILGDVYRIDFLNTTVWEVGGRDRPPGWIQAEQPTGRLITFPNNEVLSGSVINYTRDFPFVWDELTLSVANESDLTYAMGVLQRVAEGALGDYMAAPARQYRDLLREEGLETEVAEGPQVFAALTDWGANLTIRYLVAAREKRRWKSELVVRVTRELNLAAHRGRILPVYPRQQIQLVHPDGSPADVGWARGGEPREGEEVRTTGGGADPPAQAIEPEGKEG